MPAVNVKNRELYCGVSSVFINKNKVAFFTVHFAYILVDHLLEILPVPGITEVGVVRRVDTR